MIYSIDVAVTAPVADTEVEDRVADAITNVFPNAEVTYGDRELAATTHSVEAFRDRLFEQRILDTARGALLSNREGNTVAFDLKKQAAFKGVVNFAVGKPDELGEIHVEITVEDPAVEEFVDYLAPRTEDGKPVE
ncbi:RNA-binding domain-containing protein [Halobacteriaceae archaeon GCM10025711]